MNTVTLPFHQGCAMNDWVPCPDWTELKFDVVNIAGTLYARCKETHHTVSSKPNATALFKAIRKHWIDHFTSLRWVVQECKTPESKTDKKTYRVYKMRRTLELKKQLIKAGVLKK